MESGFVSEGLGGCDKEGERAAYQPLFFVSRASAGAGSSLAMC